jgi:hypothetical protein
MGDMYDGEPVRGQRGFRVVKENAPEQPARTNWRGLAEQIVSSELRQAQLSYLLLRGAAGVRDEDLAAEQEHYRSLLSRIGRAAEVAWESLPAPAEIPEKAAGHVSESWRSGV